MPVLRVAVWIAVPRCPPWKGILECPGSLLKLSFCNTCRWLWLLPEYMLKVGNCRTKSVSPERNASFKSWHAVGTSLCLSVEVMKVKGIFICWWRNCAVHKSQWLVSCVGRAKRMLHSQHFPSFPVEYSNCCFYFTFCWFPGRPSEMTLSALFFPHCNGYCEGRGCSKGNCAEWTV